jgi:ABC-type antimicrobial peptide transport system permease subunit
LLLALTGIAIGLAAAAVATRALANFLFGVKPFDPVTFAAVAALLIAVAVAAAWFPTRRATLVEPAIALRCE